MFEGTLDAPEAPAVNPEVQKWDKFVEDHHEEIAEARELYQSADFIHYKELPHILSALLEAYPKKNKDAPDVLDRIYALIVDQVYIDKEEERLHKEAEKDSFYEPNGSAGGDFFETRIYNEGNVLAETEFVDIVGHGDKTLYLKAFANRFLELFHSDHEHKEVSPSIFPDLDGFLFQMPIEHGIIMLDMIQASVTKEGNESFLNIAVAGGVQFFIRDSETGMVMKRYTEATGDDLMSEDNVKRELVDIHNPLGLGILRRTLPQSVTTNHIKLPNSCDIFFMSDGLFELPNIHQLFDKLCAEYKGKGFEEFSAAFYNLVREQIAYSKLHAGDLSKANPLDDVGAEVLRVKDGVAY